MKLISIFGLIVAVSACSTHRVKCHGPLRPVNKPAVSAPSAHPSSDSGAAANGEPQS
jgi:hypothetical protein